MAAGGRQGAGRKLARGWQGGGRGETPRWRRARPGERRRPHRYSRYAASSRYRRYTPEEVATHAARPVSHARGLKGLRCALGHRGPVQYDTRRGRVVIEEQLHRAAFGSAHVAEGAVRREGVR